MNSFPRYFYQLQRIKQNHEALPKDDKIRELIPKIQNLIDIVS